MAFENLTVEHLDAMTPEEFNDIVENFEQLDELSKKTLGSYIKKASAEKKKSYDKAIEHSKAGLTDTSPKGDWHDRQQRVHYAKFSKRLKGVRSAEKKLSKEDLDAMTPEEFNALVEDFEQLDELSKKTLASYIHKASRDKETAAYHQGMISGKRLQHTVSWKKTNDATIKRRKGIDMAANKLAKEEVELEEGLELEEGRSRLSPEDAHHILSKHNAHGDYFTLSHSTASAIADEGTKHGYRKSRNAPGSYGRMFHQHLSRLAAKHKQNEAFERWDAMTEEEFNELIENYDQLDELSKKTLGSYIKKANASSVRHAFKSVDDESKKDLDRRGKHIGMGMKRMAGLQKATDKLTKESNESLVAAALNGDAVDFQEIFNNAMAPRIKDAIERVTPELAKSMFGGKDD